MMVCNLTFLVIRQSGYVSCPINVEASSPANPTIGVLVAESHGQIATLCHELPVGINTVLIAIVLFFLFLFL